MNHPFGPFAFLPIHVHTLSSLALSHLSPNPSSALVCPRSSHIRQTLPSLPSSPAPSQNRPSPAPQTLPLPLPHRCPRLPRVADESRTRTAPYSLCFTRSSSTPPRPPRVFPLGRTPPAPFNDAPSPRQMTRVLDKLGRVRARARTLAPPVPPIPRRDDDAGLVRPRRKMAASSKIGVSDVRARGSCGRFAPSFLPFPCC